MALFGRPSERDEARVADWAAWFRRQNPFALSSLPLSVFSLTHFGTLFIDAVAGIVLGVVGIVQLARARDGVTGSGNSGAGVSGAAAKGDADGGDVRATDADAAPRTEGLFLAYAGIAVGLLSLVVAFVVYFVLPAPRVGG